MRDEKIRLKKISKDGKNSMTMMRDEIIILKLISRRKK
jgi:hypothetical protein